MEWVYIYIWKPFGLIKIKKKENLKPQDEVILGLMSQISTEKYFNEILEDSFKEKENLIKLMINYLNNYMLKILKSIQMSMLHCHFSTKSKIKKYQRIFSYDESFPYAIVTVLENSGSGLEYAGTVSSDIFFKSVWATFNFSKQSS